MNLNINLHVTHGDEPLIQDKSKTASQVKTLTDLITEGKKLFDKIVGEV